jgi:hypothetical protein
MEVVAATTAAASLDEIASFVPGGWLRRATGLARRREAVATRYGTIRGSMD